MIVPTAILVLKIFAIVSVLLHAHLTRNYIKGILLAIAMWILIPGFDEVITFPLIALFGLPVWLFMVLYYGFGLFILILALVVIP